MRPPAGQQVGERASADELVAPVAGPVEERLVDLDDQCRRRWSTGSRTAPGRRAPRRRRPEHVAELVQRAVGQLASAYARTNASIASAVSSGALKVRAVAGRVEHDVGRCRERVAHVLADRDGRDHIVAALQHQRRRRARAPRSARLSDRNVTRAKSPGDRRDRCGRSSRSARRRARADRGCP